jgi:hypothetical protein
MFGFDFTNYCLKIVSKTIEERKRIEILPFKLPSHIHSNKNELLLPQLASVSLYNRLERPADARLAYIAGSCPLNKY